MHDVTAGLGGAGREGEAGLENHESLSSGPCVLIVEDEFLIALQIESILASAGYRVVGIMSDRAGLPTLAEAPDVALVDLNLRDGPTGCEIASELAQRYGTRIVYVTANPAQIGQPARTAIGIVHKPFSQDAIALAVQQAIATRNEECSSAMALPVFDGSAIASVR